MRATSVWPHRQTGPQRRPSGSSANWELTSARTASGQSFAPQWLRRRRAGAAQIIGDGPPAQVVFSVAPAFDYRSTRAGDPRRARALMLELFRRGIFLNPMDTKLYLSVVHDEADCEEYIGHFGAALDATAGG